MGKHDKPQPDIEITHMHEPITFVDASDPDAGGLEDLLHAIFGQPDSEPTWSEPQYGPSPSVVTDSSHIVAHECDSLEVFFTNLSDGDGKECLALGFQKGHQELVVLFTEQSWANFNNIITRSIQNRNEGADKPWTEEI